MVFRDTGSIPGYSLFGHKGLKIQSGSVQSGRAGSNGTTAESASRVNLDLVNTHSST